MKIKDLITLLLEYDTDQEVFFISEEENSKIYSISKVGHIKGIPATILGSNLSKEFTEEK